MSLDAYIYQADVYCADCARVIRENIDADYANPSGWRSIEPTKYFDRADSECYPQGPYADGGGEADSPQYCGGCLEFLENPLTAKGIDYVRDSLARGAMGDGRADVLDEWSTRYSDCGGTWEDWTTFTSHDDLLAYAYAQGYAPLTAAETIVRPGPYEAEHVSVLYWSEMALDGFSGDPWYGCPDESSGAEYFILTDASRAICGRFATGAYGVRHAWDSRGFHSVAYSADVAEHAAWIAEDEASYPAEDEDNPNQLDLWTPHE